MHEEPPSYVQTLSSPFGLESGELAGQAVVPIARDEDRLDGYGYTLVT